MTWIICLRQSDKQLLYVIAKLNCVSLNTRYKRKVKWLWRIKLRCRKANEKFKFANRCRVAILRVWNKILKRFTISSPSIANIKIETRRARVTSWARTKWPEERLFAKTCRNQTKTDRSDVERIREHEPRNLSERLNKRRRLYISWRTCT